MPNPKEVKDFRGEFWGGYDTSGKKDGLCFHETGPYPPGNYVLIREEEGEFPEDRSEERRLEAAHPKLFKRYLLWRDRTARELLGLLEGVQTPPPTDTPEKLLRDIYAFHKDEYDSGRMTLPMILAARAQKLLGETG